MIKTNDSSSHALDGIDPDNQKARPLSREGRQWAYNAGMSEADKARYASTPGGSRHTSISRGR
jgi:hypothetical protein